jgi:lytic murein transglycosylase
MTRVHTIASAAMAALVFVPHFETAQAQTARPSAAPAAVTVPMPPQAAKASCTNTASFDAFLVGMKKEALAAGVKPATVSATLDGMQPDMSIIQSDRRQGFFSQTFLDFSAKLATPGRVTGGQAKIRQHKAIFDRAEKDYGVSPAILSAFWALESDFGSAMGMGKKPVLRSLATLAYDCRRSELFREQLIYAMKIIDRGDLTAEDMIGPWSAELGQTQFQPKHYFDYAIDYDGDGRRDLYRSVPDVIGTSANFVKSLGWKAGEPWLQEVRVPANMAWEQAGLDVKLPRAKWAEMGVTAADGKKLPADTMPASLILLMGRNGPAFLAYPNFDVFTKWNQSLNYAVTAAYLATRIAGAPAMSRGNAPVAALDGNQIVEVQTLLAKRGYKVGEPDGKLGAGTRLAIRQAQLKAGLPADSYPTVDFLAALRSGR